MTLDALGWNERRQSEFTGIGRENLLPGRVTSEHRTHYQVATPVGELDAIVMGSVRNSAAQRTDLPGVGDFVAVRPAVGDGPAIIEVILPRTSAIIRKASGEPRPQLLAANVDVVFIVTALDGDLNIARLERYLALIRESHATPVIVINKADIAHDASATIDQLAAIAGDVPVHFITARDQGGIAELEGYFSGNRTIALIGSSGVGKSTLTNTLLDRAAQLTQEVRAHDNRGRHTTTYRQLFIRPQGGSIMDTPGMRGLELWNPTDAATANFDDIETLALSCKFRNCSHGKEPSCAVRAAIERGELDAAHLASFIAQPTPPQHWQR